MTAVQGNRSLYQRPRRGRRLRLLVAGTAGVAGGAMVAACSSGSASPTTTAASSGSTSSTAAAPVTLRLGYLTNLTNGTPLVGLQQGIFAKNLPSSVTIQTSTYNAGPAEVTALLAGSLDAAYLGPNSAITAYSQGRGSIRIVSGAASGGAALVVSSSIKSPSQLEGKTIATPQLGNTQDVALRTWLRKEGLTFPGPNGGSGQVTILPQDNSITLSAFEAGSIAGAWVPEPWVARMVTEGHGHVLVNERSQWPKGKFSTTVLVVTTSFLQSHPSVVSGLLEGQVATTAFLTSQPSAAAQDANTQLATLTGKALKANELTAAWGDMTFTNDPIASSMLVDLQHAKAAGFPTKNITGIFDLGPLDHVLAAQGKAPVAG